MPVTAELDRFVERLHVDPVLRSRFSRDPDACLEEFAFSADEKERLRKRDQEIWWGIDHENLPMNVCICAVVAVVVVTKPPPRDDR